MKKVINGRRYDTDSAKEIGYDSFLNRTDFNYWVETLYQKSTGEFFLYGEGGPMSRYAKAIGVNEWSSGERIMPLSVEKARTWVEEHLTAGEYEKIFGDIDEVGVKKTVTFSLTEGTITTIARLAQEWNCTKSEVIEKSINKCLTLYANSV